MLVGAAALAGEPSSEHQAPVRSLIEPAHSIDAARQSILAEMWLRRVLSSGSHSWTSEDMELLLKIRDAESLGAIGLLKRRARGVSGLTAPYKAVGSRTAGLRLTREGYEKWLFYRSQEAIEYFESKGVDAKWSFHLVDLQGRALFDGAGMLTPAGDEIYGHALANLPAWWRVPATGEVFGTRPAPKPKPIELPPVSSTRQRQEPPPEPPSASPNPAPGAPEASGAAVGGAPPEQGQEASPAEGASGTEPGKPARIP